jgi:two-component system chemotaxis response regulator CheB
MFSSLTTDGAKSTLDALDAGAVDFLPKRFEDISNDKEEARRILCERVRAVGSRRPVRAPFSPRPQRPSTAASASTPPGATVDRNTADRSAVKTPSRIRQSGTELKKGQAKLIAIGTSTGGPVALQQVLAQLPKDFPLPILLIQHMPGSFTTAFAQRLDNSCAINVREAKDGDVLAPGGQQMVLEARGDKLLVHIKESEPGQNYKPCVDVTFGSIAKAMPGQALAVILTGMGADGREGARLIKDGGSHIWAQDEATCVVYGMPAAVVDAGLADQILPLDQIGNSIAAAV